MITNFKEYNLILESPNDITYNNKLYVVEQENAYPIVSEVTGNYSKIKNVLVGYEGSYHGDLGYIEGEDLKLAYRGRIWTDIKIITFFVYPSLRLFKQIIKILEDRINTKIFNNDWKIEILTGRKINGKCETEIIPIEDYIGSGNVPKEIQIMHLMNWQEKEKMRKETGTKGFGSAKTAWETPHNIKWRQALHQENKNTK